MTPWLQSGMGNCDGQESFKGAPVHKRSVSRSSRAISLVLLLAAFAWLARLVAGNLAAVPTLALALSGQLGPLNSTGSDGFTILPTASSFPTTGTPAQEGFLSSLVLVGVLCGYLLWRVRSSLPRDEGTASGFLLFLLLAVGAFLTLLVEGRAIFGLLLALAAPSAGRGGPIQTVTIVVYAAGAAVAGVSLASLVLYLGRRRLRRQERLEPHANTIASEFSHVIDSTVYSLRSGSDFRLAVLSCYKSLCDTLQDGGASDRPELTAREFEVVAERRLAVNRDHLRLITQLFEKARYSRDTVDETDAREAEESLRSLQREVMTKSGGVRS
jgi:hypothetical protein